MSYARAYPNRPTRQSMVPQHNRAHVPPEQPAGQNNATEPEPRQLEHCGAYAMLKPDQAKRDKIMRTADAETKAYEQYKQRPKKVQYHTTTGTVGGGSYNTQSSSSHQAGLAPHRPAPRPGLRSSGASVPRHNIQPCVKKPALKTQTARIDDAEIARHKAAQRQKAQTLAQKQKVRQNQLDEDRLRKNNDFLDRLEAKR